MKKFLIRNSLFFILILAAFLRFATVAKLVPFTPDEEYLIYLANTIIKDFHLIWIGVSSLGFNLYMGPFWVYFIVPFLMISKGDPIILNYLAIAFGLGTVGLLFWLGQKLFSKRVAVIASLIYALSPLIIFNDQKAYPTAVSFLSLLLTISLYMTKFSKKWWIAFAALYGFVFHLHLSLILIIFVGLYWAITHKKTLDPKTILLSVIAFIVMVSPLIAFDYFHKGSNITAPIRVISSLKKGGVKVNLAPRFRTFFTSMGRVFYLPPDKESSDEILPDCPKSQAPSIISALAIVILLFFFVSKTTWQDEKKKLIALLSLCFIIPFVFLPIINPVEYYLLGFFPLLFLIVAVTTESLPPGLKKWSYAVLIILGLLGVNTLFNAKGSFGMGSKKKLVTDVIRKIDNRPFYLSEEGQCQKYGGWRYLFSAYGRQPTKSSEDSNFSWLFPDEITDKPIHYSVIMKEDREIPGFSAEIKSLKNQKD